MNRKVWIFMFLFFVSFHVSAQRTPPPEPEPADNYDRVDPVAKFEPSLAAVIGVLSVMFALTFLLMVYAKCFPADQILEEQRRNERGRFMFNGSSYSRRSGIDKKLIESLPFFRFSVLKGSRQGLECAVCLSQFEDIEILRLLPKCKHAFHIRCIDEWLEQHGTCPLCRNRVSVDDLNSLNRSSFSFRCFNASGVREDSNMELFIEREVGGGGEEEGERGGLSLSSRFVGLGESFRKILKRGTKEKLLETSGNGDEKTLHKLNHRIVVSDIVFKNRWSNVSSSDLMFLNSEMTDSISRERFAFIEQKGSETSSRRIGKSKTEGILRIKEEMEMRRDFERKLSSIGNEQENQESRENSMSIEPGRRSVSDITTIPRFNVLEFAKNRSEESCNNASSSSSSGGIGMKEERRRRLWLPIARRTAQWFANRENRHEQTPINVTQRNLDV